MQYYEINICECIIFKGEFRCPPNKDPKTKILNFLAVNTIQELILNDDVTVSGLFISDYILGTLRDIIAIKETISQLEQRITADLSIVHA